MTSLLGSSTASASAAHACELLVGHPVGEPRLAHADFIEMARLEAKFYADEYIADADEAYAWYERFPYTSTAVARDRGRIVGFVNLFPVADAVYDALRAGTFNDKYLVADDVVDIGAELAGGQSSCIGQPPLHMFLSCIVVDEGYRGGALAARLLRAATDLYRPVEERVKAIITDNVTPAGARFSRRYGFDPVCRSNHGSQVFEQKYSTFVRIVDDKTACHVTHTCS